MTEKAATALRHGDVVRYKPSRTWSRDGVAKATAYDDGSIVLHDTYWHTRDYTSQVPDGTPVEVLFNLGDYERTEEWAWSRRAPEDREVIRAQHGYCPEFYVRKGSVESAAQVVVNAQAALEEAREQLRSATWGVEVCERALAEAEARASEQGEVSR